MTKTKSGHKALIAVGCILLACIVTCGILFYLATRNTLTEHELTPSTGAITALLRTAATGERVTIPCEEINALILHQTSGKTLPISDFYFSANEDDQAVMECHVPVLGMELSVKTSGELHLNLISQEIEYDVQSVQVGKLPVPKAVALSLLKDHIPQSISLEGSCLCVPLRTFLPDMGGLEDVLGLKEVSIEDQQLVVQAKGVVAGAQEYLSELVGDTLTEGTPENEKLDALLEQYGIQSSEQIEQFIEEHGGIEKAQEYLEQYGDQIGELLGGLSQ